MNLICYGTRPEELKLYPFTKYEGFTFCQVNQSKDLHQGLIEPDIKIEEKALRFVIENYEWDSVWVQGDTRTAFYGALYAFENNIPVIHIEAGLRTFDLNSPHPEEGYRQMIDCISTHKFCSTKEATKNCKGVYVGQTSIDTLFDYYFPFPEEDFYIVTVHRTPIDKVLPILKKYDPDKLIVFAHPNKYGQELKKHFNCLDPMNYKDFVKLMARSKGAISDSGGLQEEMIALGKEYISLRDKSERGHGETYRKGATAKIIKILGEHENHSNLVKLEQPKCK